MLVSESLQAPTKRKEAGMNSSPVQYKTVREFETNPTYSIRIDLDAVFTFTPIHEIEDMFQDMTEQEIAHMSMNYDIEDFVSRICG